MNRLLAVLSAGVLTVVFTSLAFAQAPLTLTMNEMNSSRQSGIATLTMMGGQTEVALAIRAGAADVAQPVHIHEGSCDSLGSVKYPLTDVMGGKSTTTVEIGLDALIQGDFAINVHKSGPEISVYVSCANIGAPGASVIRISEATLGNILTDGEGRALYLFTKDERNKSNCSGGCATAWPPLLTGGDPQAGPGVNRGRLGMISREDGSAQVTYNGWPLYYHAKDAQPGDITGQDRGGVWFVVHAAGGGPIQGNAPVAMAETSLGTIIVDASGRTLYLFTKDDLNKSNCSGGCLRAWPALLTVGAPKAEEGVTANLLATISREDGAMQVTYNGLPLYYYARDVKPGDTKGQNVGKVWYVVSTSGNAIGLTPAALPKTGDDLLGGLLGLSAVAGALLIVGGLWTRRRLGAMR